MNPGDDENCRVVVNAEEQYSLWPLGRDLPEEWRDAGMQGTRADCLAHVEEVWADMRPASVRRIPDAES